MHHGDVSPDIAQGLLVLKKRIDAAQIPSSKLDQTVHAAAWNIRELLLVSRKTLASGLRFRPGADAHRLA